MLGQVRVGGAQPYGLGGELAGDGDPGPLVGEPLVAPGLLALQHRDPGGGDRGRREEYEHGDANDGQPDMQPVTPYGLADELVLGPAVQAAGQGSHRVAEAAVVVRHVVGPVRPAQVDPERLLGEHAE